MRLLDRRLRRLEQQVKGRHGTLQQARLVRMSYEDLLAELVRGAVDLGMPEEQAKADPEAAVVWLGEYLQKVEAALPEEEWDRISGRGSIRGD